MTKPKLKIGLTCNGGMIRGIFKEEMSHANSAVLDSVIYKMFDRLFDCTFYLLKPLASKTTEKILVKKQSEGDEFANRFEMTFKKDLSEYPKHLDIIFAGQGPDVLLMTGKFQGGKYTHAFSYFYTLAMYPETPVFAIQTDFVTYFPTPESYAHGIFPAMFPNLFANRGMFIVPMGTTPQDRELFYCKRGANSLPSHNFMHTSVDQQFMIEPPTEDEMLPIPETCEGVAFAGKDRSQGSRLWQFILASKGSPSTPFKLIGKWTAPQTVALIEANNAGNLTYTEKAVDHAEVLKEYNRHGFTLYISCKEYRNCFTITSRFMDSLKAGAVPLIWHDEAETFKRYFDPQFVSLITVNEANIDNVLYNLQSKEIRTKIINYFLDAYSTYHNIVIGEIESIIKHVVANADELYTPMDTKATALAIKKFILERGKSTEAQVNEHIKSTFQHVGKSFWEIANANVYQTKVALGLFNMNKNKESWDDLPEAERVEITRLMNFLGK